MFARVKRAVMGRRKTVAIVATLVVAGAATALAVLPSAEASERLGTGQNPATKYGAVGKHKLPPGARRVTRGTLPKAGPRAKAFSDAVKQPRIVGGTAANASSYPYIVGIVTDFVGDVDPQTGQLIWFRATCTGTVISPTKVLTAGHCATDFTLGDSVVIAGVNNLADTTAGYVARVQSTWTNPSFNLAALNDPNSTAPPLDDVSVLTLKQPLPPTYAPVALADAGAPTDFAELTPARIVGYGITSNDPNALAGTLFEATVPIHNNTNCAANINVPDHGGYDNSRMLCAGTLGTTAEPGVDACHGDSGGPILVNNVEVGLTDWGYDPCAVDFYGVYERISTYRALITTELANPGVINPDWSGDGHSDLIGRDANGQLAEFSGSGFVDDGFTGINPVAGLIGTGWSGFTKLFRVMNWDGDGTPAIMARTSNGLLYKYKSDGHGGFALNQPTKVGSSWNIFTDIMVTNNWIGDNSPNILGRKANGDLFLYTSDGHGGWKNGGIGIKIGTSWNQFNTVLTPGDWMGDGHQALIGRTPNGDLFLYESDGAGSWLHNGIGIKIGSAWNQFKTFMSVGDFSGDNHVDVIGIQPGGLMKLYMTDGHGNWLAPVSGRPIGQDWDWNAFNTIF